MKDTVINLILLTVTSYFIVMVILYFNQENLLYFPTSQINTKFKTISLKDNNNTTIAYVVNDDNPNAIIVFGGNGDSMANEAWIYKEKFNKYTLYLLEYRGFGASDGRPNQNDIFKDAIKLYDKIKHRHQNINIIGRSLGTSVAIYLASKRDINKLVLVTPFDSILNVAKEKYWFMPVEILLKDRYESTSFVKDIKAKTLILIAQDDEIVSFKRSDSLIKIFKRNKKDIEVITFKNRGHNNITEDKNYYKVIRDFFIKNSI